jgi:ATP-dependent DNA helicase RecG
MKEKTYPGHDGIFVTKEEYQEFVRTEIVVNAVTHRDYGIKGTDIQIKMFDDRLEVDSPGIFAGMVNNDNIRYTHFSRNPKIATFLKDYGYVKEYGEGVDRMCKELESIGLPAPVFNNSTFILKTMVRSAVYKIRQNNAPIRGENASIRGENASIRPNNASIQQNDASIYADGVLSDKKKLLTEKLNRMEVSGKISIKYATEAKAVITGTDILQVITYKDVMVILSCQTTKARLILKKMEENDLIRAVQGKGKGKYVLAVPDICSED